MRDIKFRAWNDDTNSMVLEKLVMLDNGKWVDERGFELMQFTGLQDKNGVDIYEGDIVKSVSEIIKPFERRGKQNTGRMATSYKAIEYRDKSASFCIIGSALSSISQKIATKYYEVVGNIHQNPELLESK